MILNAKNLTVTLPGGTMEAIRFGSGSAHLIMLPGLGESLKSMKGLALPMALMYRIFSKDFTVWFLGRKQPVEEGCTTADMANDVNAAMDALGIDSAHLVGVSMGGMIAQHLAARHPEKVRRLVLAVTAPGPNGLLSECLDEWEDFARRGDYRGFLRSNLLRIYSPDYCRKNLPAVPLIARLTAPASFGPFHIQARACREHDAGALLSTITAPTLVIGGEQDRVLGPEASRELAQAIPGAKLHIYEQWGHGAYEEAKDFNSLVLRFLTESAEKT